MARVKPIPIREWPPEMCEAIAAYQPPNPGSSRATSSWR